MNYYDEIKNKLIDNEVYQKAKDFSKERHRVISYFETGKLLYEAGSQYGENIIKQYSEKLIVEVGKKYSERTLRRMRQLYQMFNNEKWSPMVTKLTWTHYVVLMSIDDINKIEDYLNIAISLKLSKRELELKIKANEYERLDEKTKSKVVTFDKSTVIDYVKNPIIIKANNNNEKITEKILKQLILEDMKNFLQELGQGFSYISDEYKIKIDDRYNYIDLLLYNIKYRCYVVIELKVTEFTTEYVGQVLKYMNYIDKNIKSLEEDKTIGIIICKKNNKFYMEYCSDDRIIAREYEIM